MKQLLTVLAILLVGSGLHAQDKITPELLWKLGRVSEPRISPDGKTVLYNVRTYDVAANKGQGDIYTIPAGGGISKTIVKSNDDETSARWRPDGKAIGYLANDKNGDTQLWETDVNGKTPVQVTSVKGGITNYGYAPSGDKLWYTADVKIDKNPAELNADLPLTSGARIIDQLAYREWNAWSDYTYSHLFTTDYSNGKVTGTAKDLMPGDRFDTPTKPFGGDEQISFSPDGKMIAYTCKRLTGTQAAVSTNTDIYLYHFTDGQTETISREMPGYDNDPVFSPDGKMLLWLSMETAGYEADRNRLFMYSFETKQKSELLTGFDYSVDAASFTDDSKDIYFTAAINATHQVFYLDRTKNKASFKQITTDQADYSDLSVAGKSGSPVLIASRTDMASPAEVFRIDVAKGTATQLTVVNSNILRKIKKSKVEKRMVATTDGKQMLTWVIYPPDFDPAKKYPTLLFCQGGPQSVVSQAFSYRWNFSLMAANGYIIVAPNRRGLPSFGEEWNDKITGDWGGQAMNDLLSAIDAVSAEPYVNKDKLGAVGASFGGYSVYWLAGHHNKRFKTFIAHDGVFNLTSQFGSTEEMFFVTHDMGGNYWDNPKPESYEKFSPHNYVQNWDTPILIISNEKDYRVPVTQGMEAFTAAQMRGIPSRFLYFPDEGHWVMKPQNSILWQRVFFDWLDKYLK